MFGGAGGVRTSGRPAALDTVLRVGASVRWPLLGVEVLVCVLGIFLVFGSGHNRVFCEPEVWWTAAVIATATLVTLGLAVLALLVSLCALKASKLAFFTDFARSYHAAALVPNAEEGYAEKLAYTNPGALPPQLPPGTITRGNVMAS